MSPDQLSQSPAPRQLIEVMAFAGANSRAYLTAVFQAWQEGHVVLALPPTASRRTVPGTKIIDRQVFDDDPGWFDATLELIHSDAPAQIAFSSGTTGRPKALLLTHRALSDVVGRINAAMQVDDTIREYVGVPVTFSFGFGRCRAVAAAGGRAYLPPNGFDPAEIGRMLEAGEINAISAVPTLWRVLLANRQVIGQSGAALRWVEIGSQYMSGAEKEALKELFPNARIVQHYGLTEASRATLLDISGQSGDVLDSVGQPTGDCAVEISDEGLIRLKGPHLAQGLVTGAGVKAITDADGWLTTADRGRFEGGFLYYEGRADELINSGGLKIDPTQFEQKLGEALGTPDGVAIGRVDDTLRGEQVLVAFTADTGLTRDQVQTTALQLAATFGLVGAGSVVLREVASIPRTSTGKVQRTQLAELPDLEVQTKGSKPEGTATSTPSQAGELQSLWAEVLGEPEVSLHESFYDLGGDSLSALTVIMRMEALGLDPETARMIFDGKTIAEITGDIEADNPSAESPPKADTTPQVDSVLSSRAGELQSLWAEVLGEPEVSLHESFYDLGGDSLSALTVIMRMEALGLDPETARMIFDGKTIAEIANISGTAVQDARATSVVDPLPETPALQSANPIAGRVMTLGETISAVHATRGVLVLWVVVVHWLPGVLVRISEDLTWVYQAMGPILRFGTPGFALVFGLGVGALGLAQYARSPTQFYKGSRFNTKLIVGGVMLLALFKLGSVWGKGDLGNPELPSILFYSAISYYALAMLTMPLWMKLLSVGSNRLLAIMVALAGVMVIHEFLAVTIADLRPGGVPELFKILLTAKYGYFRMTTFVMVGVAIGYLFRVHHARPNLSRELAIWGVVTATIGFVLLYKATPDQVFRNFGQVLPWHLVIYAGFALLVLAGFCHLNREAGAGIGRVGRTINAAAIASGILALPIFVGHEIVIPAKAFLESIGVPGTVALLIPLGAFLAALGYAYRRLLRFLL